MSNPSILPINIAAGIAIVVSLFPFGGKLPPKPAGYRTAIELLEKRVSIPKAEGSTWAAARA